MAKPVKKYDHLYEQITDIKNLRKAYFKVTEGEKKFAPEAIKFGMMLEYNLYELQHELKTGRYEVSPYTYHVVYEPKERGIWAPAFRDKVVHQAIHYVIKEIHETIFIKHSYACIDGKGPQRAAQALQDFMRIAEREFKDPWIVSVDVSKFFYTIDHGVIKNLNRKKINCNKTNWLLDKFVDSSPPPDYSIFKGLNVNPWNSKKIGIPLGCTTSQDSANLVLNEMDNYVVRFLGHKYYVRYMDDMNVIVDGREAALSLKRDMCLFLRQHLNLVENPKKSQIFPLAQGINAYGYKIFVTHMLIRDDSKKRAKRTIKHLDKQKDLGFLTEAEVQQKVNSWLGHARHSNSFNLATKIYAKYPYIKVEGNEQFGERRLN